MGKKQSDIIVSGMRATGNLHLGNYFGAARQFIKIQEKYPCFFFIADYHSLTTHPNPENLYQSTRQVLAEYLASGIDPEKSTIYMQSDVKEVLELYLYFNMNAYLGELERVPTFKEKARNQPQNVNAGLLTYPTLMASDILIHKGSKVPVGKDQEQNLEMARKFARRFNNMYQCNIFPGPTPFQENEKEDLIKIPGLDGSGKMSKSEGPGNAIFLADEPKVIRKKVMRAVTDQGPEHPNQEKSPSVKNLFTLMFHLSSRSTYEHFEEQYNTRKIRYGDMKKQLAEDIILFTGPVRERIREILSDREYLQKVAGEGAEKARESAQKTLQEVREVIGFKRNN